MRSSTSNFDATRVPGGGRWRRVWLAAAAMAGAVLGVLEVFLRCHGYQPSVVDSEKLWAHWRHGVGYADARTVVLLGSSRMVLGFSPDAWREEFPAQRVVQLAICGGSALPALRDLAAEPGFRGTVICEMEAWQLIGSAEQARTQGFVDYHRQKWVSPFQDVECRLRTAVQGCLVVTIAGPGYRQVLGQLLHGRSPQPKPLVFRTHPDRCVDGDFTKTDCRVQEAAWAENNAKFRAANASFSKSDWRAVVEEVRTLAARIEQRGGRVLFVRFPTSGGMRASDERDFPRADYWDVLAASVRAVHCEDVPALRGFTCPDESHLDVRDKRAFTRALARELDRRQWIPGGQGDVAPSRSAP
jgi:hypothetical protein